MSCTRWTSCGFVMGAGLLLLPVALRSQAPTDRIDAMLAMGVVQVQGGDFETAVFTLDTVVRRLEGSPARSKDLARAYLYLGAAYVGLDHETAARGKFRNALRCDPTLLPNREELPPKVIELFEEERLRAQAVSRKRGRKVAILVAAGVAATGVGIAATATKETPPANRPPEPSITVAPEGQMIAGVTQVRLSASASDPDGDTVTYAWDLGDGTTASDASVVHVYAAEGNFVATLRASDGRGGAASASAGVAVRSLSGAWRSAINPQLTDDLDCVQVGNRLDCVGRASNPDSEFSKLGCWVVIGDPRRVVTGEYWERWGGRGSCGGGEVQSDLKVIVCPPASEGANMLRLSR